MANRAQAITALAGAPPAAGAQAELQPFPELAPLDTAPATAAGGGGQGDARAAAIAKIIKLFFAA